MEIVQIDSIIHDIRAWGENADSFDSISATDFSSPELPTAESLIEDVESLRFLTKDGYFTRPALQLRLNLPHDEVFFGSADDLGQRINASAEHYFSQSWYRSNALDWIYVNVLVAYTYQRHRNQSESLTADIIGGKFYRGVLELIDGKRSQGVQILLGYVLTLLVKAALIILPLALSGSEFLLPASLFSGAVLFSMALDRHRLEGVYLARKQKALEDLQVIKRVYALAVRKNIPWEDIRDELQLTRGQGICWLTGLYAAARGRCPSEGTERQ